MSSVKGNIIICGSPRAGTTSLFRYLSFHPKIGIPDTKELNFFIGGGDVLEDTWNNNIGFDEYQACFSEGENDFSVEASPAYMHPCYAASVAPRIKKVVPDVKLIFILRDPLERLYSHFDGRKKRGNEWPESFSFTDFVSVLMEGSRLESFGVKCKNAHLDGEGLILGAYVNTIKTYLNTFPPENIQIVFTEDLAGDPHKVMQDICDWLSVPSEIYQDYKFNVENEMINTKNKFLYVAALYANRLLEPLLNHMPSLRHGLRTAHHFINAKPQSRHINKETCEILHKYYEDHNEKLLSLLDEYWPRNAYPSWLNKRK